MVVVVEKANITSSVGRMIKGIPYHFIDIGISIEHFCLQAAEEGLGTCIIGWFNEKPLKKLLNIPKYRKIAVLITLGYPDKNEVPEKVRKPIEEIYKFNSY